MPAVEVLIANYAVRNLIRENKIHQIDLVIETSSDKGMVSIKQITFGACKAGTNIVRECRDILT